MRRSTRHGLVGVAGAFSLGLLLSLVLAATAGAAGSSLLSSEALPSLHVQVGSLLNVEASPLPAKVEVPGVVTVETPPLPRVEAPSTPPVETPQLPVETPTTPTVSTPVPVTTGSSSTPSQPSSGSQESAHAASNSSAGSSSGASPRSVHGASSATTSPSSGGRQRSSTHTAPRDSRARAAHARHATHAATGSTAASTVPGTVQVTSVSPKRSSSHSGTKHKAAASDPLNTLGRQIPFPVPVPDWSKPIILLLLLLAIGFAVRAALATRRARRLEAQQATMRSDLDEMQKALVPAVPERLGSLAVSVAYRPADGPAAGGDFYDLFALDGEKVAIVVGDVVGHGREAVAQAALTRYTLRAYLQAGLEPRAALALAGSVLTTPAEMRFATVVVAIHDGATGRLTYACAGHPPPIAVGFEVPEPITVCCSAPICCDLPTGRRQTVLSLPESAGLCFFSDGLPEARTADGLLGRERLASLLAELGSAAKAPVLIERVRDQAPATTDDMVACIVSSTARGPVGTGSTEELETDPEMLEGPRMKRFLEACGLDRRRVESALAQARELARCDGRALVRVERPLAGEPSVLVKPCAPPAGATIADAATAAEPALALQTAR